MELSNSGQASQSTRDLISMQDSKISNSKRHVSEASKVRLEDQTMGRTVHWLESKLLILNAAEKHVFCILEVMATGFPKFVFEHGWSVDFGEASVEILFPH